MIVVIWASHITCEGLRQFLQRLIRYSVSKCSRRENPAKLEPKYLGREDPLVIQDFTFIHHDTEECLAPPLRLSMTSLLLHVILRTVNDDTNCAERYGDNGHKACFHRTDLRV